MNILSLFVVIPALMLLGLWIARNVNQVRGVMVAGSSCLLAMSVWLTLHFISERAGGNTEEMILHASTAWFPALHINYEVGVDGISVVMLLLSSIIVFTGTFASWKLKPLTKEFFMWFTLLSTGVYGFFISIDLFTMFMFYEVALIPMYLLIGFWGSGRKEYAAMKLTLMLMGGSALIILGLVGIYFFNGASTMNILEIAHNNHIPAAVQNVLFPFVFIGFGVLGALFPFHTWSPIGHGCAPTSVSMLHAGVLMKLGGYGCFRIAMFLLPQAANDLAWIFLILTTISVVYGAFSACVQTDLKFINAYSSVSHCGLVLFALLMMTKVSCTGAILQMLSHGLMTALFFALIGMIYGRTHTRDIRELGGLMKIMPFLSVGYVIAGLERFVRECRHIPPLLHRHRYHLNRCDRRVHPPYRGLHPLREGEEPALRGAHRRYMGRALRCMLPHLLRCRSGFVPDLGKPCYQRCRSTNPQRNSNTLITVQQ